MSGVELLTFPSNLFFPTLVNGNDILPIAQAYSFALVSP